MFFSFLALFDASSVSNLFMLSGLNNYIYSIELCQCSALLSSFTEINLKPASDASVLKLRKFCFISFIHKHWTIELSDCSVLSFHQWIFFQCSLSILSKILQSQSLDYFPSIPICIRLLNRRIFSSFEPTRSSFRPSSTELTLPLAPHSFSHVDVCYADCHISIIINNLSLIS